ncbi:hypothetical protein OCU04_009639 [Sclerotinia nivalis]|uniref:Uncharacterized protein n=1 Tax=Sclerotinia nivalis TaxID=352851 RepID=A0A9X0DHI4_9HELO|nr:hypothetical protein OCU04_009639 [Sclerotinia nivalis]
MAGERGRIAMEKCHMCSKTTFQIESPTEDCDRRLKTCLKFMTKRANGKHVNDDERVNGRRYKWLTNICSCDRFLQLLHKKFITKYLFEVRITEVDENGQTKWTSEFWEPKNWDPEKDNADSGLRNKMLWMINGPFEALMGHFLCPMEGRKKCNDECRIPENSKHFRLVENVQAMVISMNCKCTRENPLPQRWHVRLYQRRPDGSTRDDEQDAFLEYFQELRENPKEEKTSPNKEKLPTIEEETEEVIENHEGEPENDNSLVGSNISSNNTEANDPTIQENTVGLNNGNPQSLKDENISATDFLAGGDNDSDDVDDGISPWQSTLPQNRGENFNDRIWNSPKKTMRRHEVELNNSEFECI